MALKSTRNRIALLLFLVFAGSFAMSNIVLAQSTPGQTADKTIKKTDFTTAQPSLQTCLVFKKLVAEVTQGKFKAAYGHETIRGDTFKGCHIVPDSYPDADASGNFMEVDFANNPIPLGSKNIEAAIVSGAVLDQKTLAENFQIDQNAQNEAGGVSKAIGGFIVLIFNVLSAFVGLFTGFVGGVYANIVDNVMAQNTMPVIVTVGWTLVRDFCNMFFIIILIVIALASILRLEKYNYKTLLGQVVIMAILVNFSKVIATTLIDFSNMLTMIFHFSGTRNIFAFFQGVAWQDSFSTVYTGWMAGLVQGITKLVFMFVGLTVFISLAGLFIVRLVGLYVLVIFSPIAYVLNILPGTKKFAEQWWSTFIKYLIWAPVAAFMIRLTIMVVDGGGLNGVSYGNDSAFKYIIIAGFMFASVIVAQQAGMIGSKQIIDIGNKAGIGLGLAVGKGVGKAGFGYAGRKWNEFTANKIRGTDEEVSKKRAFFYAVLNPRAFAKGWTTEAEEANKRAHEKAAAAGREVVEQRLANPIIFLKKHGSGLKRPRVLEEEKKEEDAYAKTLQSMSREKVAKKVHELFGVGRDEKGKAAIRGAMKLAMSKGYVDDIIQLAHQTDEGRRLMEEMKKVGDLKLGEDYKVNEDGKEELIYNHRTRRALQMSMFGGKLQKGFVDSTTGKFYEGTEKKNANDVEAETYHIKDHAGARLVTEEGELEGKATGHYEYMTDQVFNGETGEYESYILKKENGQWHSEGEKSMAGAEIAKMGVRQQAQLAWHSMMSSDGQAFYGNVYAKVAQAFVDQPGYMQERTADKLLTGVTDEDKVREIRDGFRADGVLRVDKNSLKRLQEMSRLDNKALVAVLGRFLNQSKPNEITELTKALNGKLKVEVNGAVTEVAVPLTAKKDQPVNNPNH